MGASKYNIVGRWDLVSSSRFTCSLCLLCGLINWSIHWLPFQIDSSWIKSTTQKGSVGKSFSCLIKKNLGVLSNQQNRRMAEKKEILNILKILIFRRRAESKKIKIVLKESPQSSQFPIACWFKPKKYFSKFWGLTCSPKLSHYCIASI